MGDKGSPTRREGRKGVMGRPAAPCTQTPRPLHCSRALQQWEWANSEEGKSGPKSFLMCVPSNQQNFYPYPNPNPKNPQLGHEQEATTDGCLSLSFSLPAFFSL